MKCLVPGLNVKILGRAVQAMARIGDDLYVESLPRSLALRTINSAESAYCVATFEAPFFVHYDCGATPAEREDEDSLLKCKISARSALAVFRSDRRAEACEIALDPDASKLVFKLKCKHGVLKTFFVSILECKKMEAAYSKEGAPNRISAGHKVFADAINNFQPSDDQITLEATSASVSFRNYSDSGADASKTTRTRLSLPRAEFDDHSVRTETTVTFPMKEFRATLAVSETLNLPVSAHFETAGRPIVFVVRNDSAFEMNFVMATERPEGETQSVASSGASAKRNGAQTERPSKRFAPEPPPPEDDPFDFFEDDSHLLNLPDGDVSNAAPTADRDPRSGDRNLPADDENEPPLSPPLHVKAVFRRCFDETVVPSKRNAPVAVLAGDSDSD